MKPLDLLLLSAEYIENKEGVVITFSNGKMAKQKHQHYMLLHGILADGLKEHILISKILNEEIDDLYPYIISFSECWDSLPMWNTYGNKSKGIAIGFNKEKLSQIEEYKFEKCVYESKEYEQYLTENIKQIHSCLHIDSYSISFSSGFDNNLLKQHYKFLPILKNKSYNYEDEYRLIIPSKVVEKKELKFQTSDSLLKPYKEISIPFEYVTEIILGPLINLEKLKTALFFLLKQKNKIISLDKEHGKIHLRKSNIPFRDI